MNKGIKHTIYQYTTLLLLVVMAMLTFNQSVNLHTHILNDGTIITHAHPYQKTNDAQPIKSHNHSMKEFTILNQLNILFTLILIALAVMLYPVCHRRVIPIYIHHEKCDAKLILGRAPPVFNS